MKSLVLILALTITAVFTVQAQNFALPETSEAMPGFIEQLRSSFEEDVFGSPLTDGQWQNFKIAVAFLITTADDAQWAAFKNRSGQDINEFQWVAVKALLTAEADAFLRSVDR